MPETKLTMSAYTDAQLHALACITCGRTDSELQPSGHVRTESCPGQYLVWAVATCPEHRTGAGARRAGTP